MLYQSFLIIMLVIAVFVAIPVDRKMQTLIAFERILIRRGWISPAHRYHLQALDLLEVANKIARWKRVHKKEWITDSLYLEVQRWTAQLDDFSLHQTVYSLDYDKEIAVGRELLRKIEEDYALAARRRSRWG